MANSYNLQTALDELLDEDELLDLGTFGGGGDADAARDLVARAPHLKDLVRELAMDPTFSWLFPAWEALVLATDPGLFKYAPAITDRVAYDKADHNNYFIELLFLYYTNPYRREWSEAIHNSTALRAIIQQLNNTPEKVMPMLKKTMGDPIGFEENIKPMHEILKKLGASPQVIKNIEEFIV